jgi:hypothetical protein
MRPVDLTTRKVPPSTGIARIERTPKTRTEIESGTFAALRVTVNEFSRDDRFPQKTNN